MESPSDNVRGITSVSKKSDFPVETTSWYSSLQSPEMAQNVSPKEDFAESPSDGLRGITGVCKISDSPMGTTSVCLSPQLPSTAPINKIIGAAVATNEGDPPDNPEESPVGGHARSSLNLCGPCGPTKGPCGPSGQAGPGSLVPSPAPWAENNSAEIGMAALECPCGGISEHAAKNALEMVSGLAVKGSSKSETVSDLAENNLGDGSSRNAKGHAQGPEPLVLSPAHGVGAAVAKLVAMGPPWTACGEPREGVCSPKRAAVEATWCQKDLRASCCVPSGYVGTNIHAWDGTGHPPMESRVDQLLSACSQMKQMLGPIAGLQSKLQVEVSQLKGASSDVLGFRFRTFSAPARALTPIPEEYPVSGSRNRGRSLENVRQRPTSFGSDVCQVSSPPSSNGSGVVQAPARETENPVGRESRESLEGVNEGERPARAKFSAWRPNSSPIVGYKMERGARVPVYQADPIVVPELPITKSPTDIRGSEFGPAACPAVPVQNTMMFGVAPVSPVNVVKSDWPRAATASKRSLSAAPSRERSPVKERTPSHAHLRCRTAQEIFNDDVLEFQCCECGDVFSWSDDMFVCPGVSKMDSEPCEHFMCEPCVLKLSSDLCVCDHKLSPEGVPTTLTDVCEGPTGSDPCPTGKNAGDVSMAQLMGRMMDLTETVISRSASAPPRSRSMLKTNQVLEFPVGSAAALEDLDSWLQEFDRVMKHLCGVGSTPEDRIHQLLACWPMETLVGGNLRMDQNSKEYRQLYDAGNIEGCWSMLLGRLNSFRAEPVVSRRKAEELWRTLTWTGDCESFHTVLRKTLTACARNNIPRTDYEVVIKYLELIPREAAITMEGKLETYQMMGRYAEGWPLDILMREEPINTFPF